jgi:hypothetical protein
MMFSDGLGFVASLLLAWAPVRDQLHRWDVSSSEKKAKPESKLKDLRARSPAALEQRRNAFSISDSAFTCLGAIGLAIAFGLKACGN